MKIDITDEQAHSSDSTPGSSALDNLCENDFVLDKNEKLDGGNDKNKKKENTWSKEDFDIFKKLLQESFANLPKRNEILVEKTNEEENDVKTEEENEHLEDAKLWAVKQKRSLGLNK